ncbi:MAG: hypothetical protein IIB17_06795 [Chloroflexi bacterium]|nr:hypothetical protein [Chloroflexota bacterium]
MIRACLMMLVGIIGLAACGGAEAKAGQPAIQAPGDDEAQVREIRLTPSLEAEIRQVIRNEMALIASSTAVTATSTGFLPAHMHFALIEVINSVTRELESQVSRLASQISDNAYSFDEYSYYLAGSLGDLEYQVSKLQGEISNLEDQINCVVAGINRAERVEDVDDIQC